MGDKLDNSSSQLMCDLRLELNQQQQERAALELKLRQQEERIIKLQAELEMRDTAYKSKVEEFEERLLDAQTHLKSITEKNVNPQVDIDSLRNKEKEYLDQIGSYEKVLGEFEKSLNNKMNELDRIKSENETDKGHLNNLEIAFSDLHQKYERSKQLIENFRANEEMLKQGLLKSNEVAKKNEEKYDSLKAHAKAQIERSNKEWLSCRDKHQSEVQRMSTIIKRLEIKNASLVQTLEQKSNECDELAALCNEVTGRID